MSNGNKPVFDQFYPGGTAQQAIDWNITQHQLMGFNSTIVTIPAAQILTLFSNPITIVSGQAGKIIIPVFVVAQTLGAPAYGMTGVTGLYLSWPSLIGIKGITFSNNLLSQGSNYVVVGSLGNTDMSSPTGSNLIFCANGANPTSGGASVTLNVWYDFF